MKRGRFGTARKAALFADANDYAVQPNKSLDASGGSVFRIITRPAMLE